MPAKRRLTAAEFAYQVGDTVFLRVAAERVPGFVTGIIVRPAGVLYEVTWESGVSAHFDFELTDTYVPDFGADKEED
jgi:hypothetical protein